jgi:polyhydroxyalkanoate synthesis regulator phasin
MIRDGSLRPWTVCRYGRNRLNQENSKMFDALKQSVFAGLGVASLTREKIGEMVAEISKAVELTPEQRAEFEAQVNQRAERARGEWEAEIDRRIDHALLQVGIVKAGIKKDAEQMSDKGRVALEDMVRGLINSCGVAHNDTVAALETRVAALEKKLAEK